MKPRAVSVEQDCILNIGPFQAHAPPGTGTTFQRTGESPELGLNIHMFCLEETVATGQGEVSTGDHERESNSS